MMKLAAWMLLVTACISVDAVDWDVTTLLDEYVQSDDEYFQWSEIASYNKEGVTLYIVNMTSQRYMTDDFVTRSVWWHIMGIAIPDEVKHLDFGILWIGGQSNTDYPEGELPPENNVFNVFAVRMANDTGIICGYILHIPNQPVVFSNDPNRTPRWEDDIIGWSWRTYLDDPEPDPKVILRMPMTKAAKRGLDTMYEFAKLRVPGSDLQRFGVVGASKRGWTTYSLAATDRRVVAMVPLVFSLIKLRDTAMNHFQDMDGNWAFALRPYWDCNLTQEYFNPKSEEVFSIEDMWEYRERFTIPMLAISATGDEFFVPEENRYWWDGIPSQHKFLMMLPNAEHSMVPHWIKMYETAVSFITIFIENLEFPSVSWYLHQNEIGSGGYIEFSGNPPPAEIAAYSAVTLGNDTRRDFRLLSGTPGDVSVHPVRWRKNLEIQDLGNGNYRVDATEVDGEWVGFFMEGTWVGPTGMRMIFTSQVNIVPDTHPHEPCIDAESCWGKLV